MRVDATVFSVLLLAGHAVAADSGTVRFEFDVQGIAIEFDDDRPLFELHLALEQKDPDEKQLAPKDFAKVDRAENKDRLTITWGEPPAPWPKDLRVTATLTRLKREIEARLRIDNPGPLPVTRVRFPIIAVRPTYHYDTLLLSHPMGDAMYYPKRVIGARMGGEAVYRYPATLAMQYMVLFNQGRSYYLSAYSTGDETFEHSAKTIRRGLRLSCVWYPFLEKGEWQSPTVGSACCPADGTQQPTSIATAWGRSSSPRRCPNGCARASMAGAKCP